MNKRVVRILFLQRRIEPYKSEETKMVEMRHQERYESFLGANL